MDWRWRNLFLQSKLEGVISTLTQISISPAFFFSFITFWSSLQYSNINASTASFYSRVSIIKSSLILKWQKLTNYYADGWENSWEIWIILNYEAVCQLSQYLFIKIFFWSFPGLPWVSSLFESIQGVNEPCMPSSGKGSLRKKRFEI